MKNKYYRISASETVFYEIYVRADSPEEAHAIATNIPGDELDELISDSESFDITAVDEVERDMIYDFESVYLDMEGNSVPMSDIIKYNA